MRGKIIKMRQKKKLLTVAKNDESEDDDQNYICRKAPEYAVLMLRIFGNNLCKQD